MHAFPAKRGHISREGREYVDTIMKIFMAALLKDHDVKVVAATLEGIKRLVKRLGFVRRTPSEYMIHHPSLFFFDWPLISFRSSVPLPPSSSFFSLFLHS